MKRYAFIQTHKEAHKKDTLWKLNKYVNGLCDASLSWYYKVCEVMDQCNVTKSKLCPVVFIGSRLIRFTEFWCAMFMIFFGQAISALKHQS